MFFKVRLGQQISPFTSYVNTEAKFISFLNLFFAFSLKFCQARPKLKLKPYLGLASLISNFDFTPTHHPHTLKVYYLSHFSMDWAEILHDCSLGGKDQVCRQNIMKFLILIRFRISLISFDFETNYRLIRNTSALQGIMQCCRVSVLSLDLILT